jgi:hypothetical protein
MVRLSLLDGAVVAAHHDCSRHCAVVAVLCDAVFTILHGVVVVLHESLLMLRGSVGGNVEFGAVASDVIVVGWVLVAEALVGGISSGVLASEALCYHVMIQSSDTADG